MYSYYCSVTLGMLQEYDSLRRLIGHHARQEAEHHDGSLLRRQRGDMTLGHIMQHPSQDPLGPLS